MELKQMRYFVALAEERNFSRAAARLNMAQPPLTRQIRQLAHSGWPSYSAMMICSRSEAALGTPLFVRTAKGVDLTEAGQSCITTDSAGNLRLPGVVYRPFRSPHLRDLELSCFYRRGDASPVLQEFLAIVRQFAATSLPKAR